MDDQPSAASHQGDEAASAQRGGSPMPWQRLRHESAVAYAAFLQFRDLGPSRNIAQVAQAMSKSTSLLYRWSSRYRWFDRGWEWDRVCSREEEAALREQRQEMLRRQLRDSDRLQRLAMAKLTGLVHRDPATGEPQLDPSVKPRDAVSIYRLALQIQESIAAAAPQPSDAENSPDTQLRHLSDAELEEFQALIRLAQERAGGNQGTREDEQ